MHSLNLTRVCVKPTDSTQVEMRQLDVYMENLKSKTGGYKSSEQEDEGSLTDIIYDILKPIAAPETLLENIESIKRSWL